ncbi:MULTISPECIES: GntR family transcriptional regulator [unclassified Paludibacterium]|uniref:GntR family transcriptional regulator n=1 Tax=unclassified Paludibacterium TaxID=2618429 RepID=UPI001C04A0C6|nr:GntR family transcriptional regulator [Paludibacterium sp. B53371]
MMRNTLRRLPLYAQIKSVLIRRIGEGEWQANQALPSEWELAAQLDVSQGTVRKALGELVAQGILYRRQGRGTFVADVASDWGEGCLVTPGLLDEKPDELGLELLGCSRGNAPEEVARLLGLRRGAPVIRVRQLWRLRGLAVALDDVYLPAEPFDGLDARWIRQCGGGVYVALQRRFGVRPRVTAAQLRAVMLGREDAALLGVEPEQPVLSMLRVSASMEGEPLEWRQRICLTSALAYTTGRGV